MEACPCGSGAEYARCCEPLITGSRKPSTAEALMRARYTAFVKTAVDFISETIHPSQRKQYNPDAVAAWSSNSEWQGLEIVHTEKGGPEDTQGTVEFIARYIEKEKPIDHHEIAEFVKSGDTWYFYDGNPPKPVQVVRQGPKIGRNDPCPCGSGRKSKKCCDA